jgi:hypothetical protein
VADSTEPKRRFLLYLVKPSHYDDDGYVVQWLRSSIPSNSLAMVYALAAEAAERQVLGPDVAIEISALDETNARVPIKRMIRQITQNGGFGMVGLVGVQSNQFPRTLDIARKLREAGIQVMIGGFHVSGCLAMLPGMQTDLQDATSASACSPARPRGGWTACCATPPPARWRRSTTTSTTCRRWRRRARPICRAA